MRGRVSEPPAFPTEKVINQPAPDPGGYQVVVPFPTSPPPSAILIGWLWLFKSSACALPLARRLSTPLALSHPRTNSPRKSGVPNDPFAGIQPVGQAARLNAITAPVGAAVAI